jgi:hypothetical protein
MSKNHSQKLLSLVIVLVLLSACNSAAPAPATPTPARPAIPVITPTPTRRPTETPKATATATATEKASLPAEAMAAWDKLNLQSKDQWKVENIAGYGLGFARVNEAGEREEIVDLPITFSNGQGQKTTVHQLCYKTQTSGAGALSMLTCMDQPRAEHRLMTVKGNDSQALAFFKWAANYPAFQSRNPQLLQAFKDGAEGKKNIVIVYGDINNIPPEYRVHLPEVQAKGLKIEGMPYAALDGLGNQTVSYSVVPFVRGNTVFLVRYKDYEGDIDFAINRGDSLGKELLRKMTSAIRDIFYISDKGVYPTNKFNSAENSSYENDLKNQLANNGLILGLETTR